MFLDQDAVPTIIEVKRSTDTRVRREVVGQMLDYAANAAQHWPVSHMQERYASSCGLRAIDPEEELVRFLAGEIEPDEFWDKADRNLKERRLRLVFVADKIPTELQSIVEFLNEQMDHTEVLAIEIKHYVSQEGLRSLVPRVIGQTAKARDMKGPNRRSQTTEEEFFAELQDKSSEAANVARRILEWSSEHFTSVEWKGASFVPKLDYGADYTHNPITVFGLGKVPRVGIKFWRLKNRNGVSDKQRLELLRRLNEIPGVQLNADILDKHPMIPLIVLSKGNALEQFLAAIEWTNEEVRAAAT